MVGAKPGEPAVLIGVSLEEGGRLITQRQPEGL